MHAPWDEGPEPHDFKQETYDRLLDLADEMRDRAKETQFNVRPDSATGKEPQND